MSPTTLRPCARCGERVDTTRHGYLCPDCRPARRCRDCHEPIPSWRRPNARYCLDCATRHRSLRTPAAVRTEPRRCADCGKAVGDLLPNALHCPGCALERKREHSADYIDARFSAALKHIKASGRHRLTAESATAQRGDWAAWCNARTPDTAGLSLPELRARPSRAKGGRA